MWHKPCRTFNPWCLCIKTRCLYNSLRPRLNRRPFADDIFKCIFLNENKWILPRISLKFVPKVRINNIPALVQIMAWRRPGDKPLSEPKMVSLLTHLCVTRPQWDKTLKYIFSASNASKSNEHGWYGRYRHGQSFLKHGLDKEIIHNGIQQATVVREEIMKQAKI